MCMELTTSGITYRRATETCNRLTINIGPKVLYDTMQKYKVTLRLERL